MCATCYEWGDGQCVHVVYVVPVNAKGIHLLQANSAYHFALLAPLSWPLAQHCLPLRVLEAMANVLCCWGHMLPTCQWQPCTGC